MPQSINGVTLIATKMASGNVKLQFQNAVGGIIFVISVPTADLASLHTTVNSGSQGTSITRVYSQDSSKADYDHDTFHSEGN